MKLYLIVEWFNDNGVMHSGTDNEIMIEKFKSITYSYAETPYFNTKYNPKKISLYELSFDEIKLMGCYDFERKDENNAIQEKLENDMKNIDKEELKELLKGDKGV